MKIVIGSDHVGLPLKHAVIDYLTSLEFEVADVGPGSSDGSVDYPDFAHLVSQAVANGEHERGILICGTGLGMSIAANRHPGIRAALCDDIYTAHQSRAHNDSNVLCLGAWVVTPQRVERIVQEWLETPFEGARHVQRLAKLEVETTSAKPEGVPLSLGPELTGIRFGLALSPRQTSFGPLLFAGRLEQGLRAVAEAGLELVELSLRTAEDIDEGELEGMLGEHGLSLAAIATGQSCLYDSLCLTDPSADVRRSTVERLKSMVQLASRFGASVIIGGIRGRLRGEGEDQQRQRGAAIAALKECARFAAVHEVELLVEPINRYETNFINTASEALTVMDEVGEPSFKLLLDTFHMNIEEVDLDTTLHDVGDRLGYVHIADSNREAPGRGHINFASAFQALVEIGYRGPVTAEILPIPSDAEASEATGVFVASLF